MIRRTFQIVLLLLLSVWLGVQLYHDPGYLLIGFHQWTVETTLGVAIPSLIMLFFIFHSLLLFFHWIIHLPGFFRHWRQQYRANRARLRTRRGLIEFSEGHWLKAKNDLTHALNDTDTPLLNYLTAARAAQELGDSHLRDDYLRQAQQSMPDAKIAVELTQAQLQLANRQWEQALATLKHLQVLAPSHPYVLKLLMQLYQEVQDWPQLINLLPALKKQQIISQSSLILLQKQAYLQTMLGFIKNHQSKELNALLISLPKELKQDVDFIYEQARYLIDIQEHVKAEELLRSSLQKQYNRQLIDVYGLIDPHVTQLSFVESLLKKTPHCAHLFLCLARLSFASQLWGKVKFYLEESIKINPTSAAFEKLGQLCERNNDKEGALNAYRAGLLLMEY